MYKTEVIEYSPKADDMAKKLKKRQMKCCKKDIY